MKAPSVSLVRSRKSLGLTSAKAAKNRVSPIVAKGRPVNPNCVKVPVNFARLLSLTHVLIDSDLPSVTRGRKQLIVLRGYHDRSCGSRRYDHPISYICGHQGDNKKTNIEGAGEQKFHKRGVRPRPASPYQDRPAPIPIRSGREVSAPPMTRGTRPVDRSSRTRRISKV